MAATLRNGSRGADVRQLQSRLNNAGYNLSVDGRFGKNTLAAVRDYQQKNGLSVDGVVGTNTWAKLNGGGNTTQGSAGNPSAQQTMSSSTQQTVRSMSGVSPGTNSNLQKLQGGYAPSESVNSAYQKLQDVLNKKPDSYTSPYDSQIQDIYDKIMNRKDFSYDLNADPTYQQYRQQYVNLGKQAMQDTMGNAAALTGGYGNSYASTAGNQAYQQYLTHLNDIVPDLEANAYARYLQEGQDMRNQYDLAADRENTAYGRYMDALNDYYNQYALANDAYNTERNFDYGKYADQLAYWQQLAASENADYWNQKDYDFQQAQWEYQKAQAAKSGSGGSRRGGSSRKSSSSKNNSYSQPTKEASRDERLQALAYYTMEPDDAKLNAYMSTLAKKGVDTDAVWDYLQQFTSSNQKRK